MGDDIFTLGSLEPSYATLHMFFCQQGQNTAVSVGAHHTTTHNELWTVYRGLGRVRDLLEEQRDSWNEIQLHLAELQATVDQACQHGYLPNTAQIALSARPQRKALSPPIFGELHYIVDSIDLSLSSSSWNINFSQKVLPLEIRLMMQQLPVDVLLFRQKLHQIRRYSDEAQNMLLRIVSHYQQRSMIQQSWQCSSKREKIADAANSTKFLNLVQTTKTNLTEEARNADLFVEEMSKYGKLVKSSGFISEAMGVRILRALSVVVLPSRLDLSIVRAESILLWRGLFLALAVKDSTKDLTIPPLSPSVLQVLSECFRVGQLERLEMKTADDETRQQAPASPNFQTLRGVEVKNAFSNIGKLATVSLSLLLYKEWYDYEDVLLGLQMGFMKLATQPSFRLVLSLQRDFHSITLGDTLLRTDIVTEIFLDARELNDLVYAVISRLVQSPSLRKLYICDAVLHRIEDESLLQRLINSFDRTTLELLVLGGLSCNDDDTGLDFLDAVFRSLASICPIQHLWLNFAESCRARGIQRQRKLIEYLPAMKAIRSFTVDYYPETAKGIRKGALGIDLRWNKVPKHDAQTTISTPHHSEMASDDAPASNMPEVTVALE